jgi:hypothetical protein
MTPAQFIAKWKHVVLTERSASQSLFNDFCALLGHPTPIDADADADGTWFTFEKEACKRSGDGWAGDGKRVSRLPGLLMVSAALAACSSSMDSPFTGWSQSSSSRGGMPATTAGEDRYSRFSAKSRPPPTSAGQWG